MTQLTPPNGNNPYVVIANLNNNYSVDPIGPNGAGLGIYTDPDHTAHYTSFNKARMLRENYHSLIINYGVDNERVESLFSFDSATIVKLKERKRFALNYEKTEKTNGYGKEICYIYSPYGIIAANITYKGGLTSFNDEGALHFIYTDHLGSLTTITDHSGSVVDRRSFDAWGKPRDPLNWSKKISSLPRYTDRGYTGHEFLEYFGLINMNGRMYDPIVGRFLSPDPYVQAPFNSQNFNRYSYCLNNPLKYTDPDGQWVHIVIGAVVGGVINLGIKAYQGKINSWGDGFAAFGIGAIAGAVGAATGGAAFAAAGGAAGGAGGFLAGAAGGMVGSAVSMPIQSVGNSLYFGDPMMTGKQYIMGIAIGGLVGGTINGGTALGNGRTFWNGTLPTPSPSPTPLPLPVPSNKSEIQLPNNGRSQLAQVPEDNSFTLRTTTTETPNYSIEGQSIKISMQRQEITGYDASLTGKTDLYHNFPTLLDKTIVQQGAWAQRIKDAAFWFEAPGTINGIQGVYTIGVNQQGVIFHRCFYPY